MHFPKNSSIIQLVAQNPTNSHQNDTKWLKVEEMMDPYFSSKQIHSVDAKGRIVVPVKFREKLGDKFVVAWLGEYLTLYPIDEWNKLLEKLERELPATESDLIDILSYNSETLEMDKPSAGHPRCRRDRQGRGYGRRHRKGSSLCEGSVGCKVRKRFDEGRGCQSGKIQYQPVSKPEERYGRIRTCFRAA